MEALKRYRKAAEQGNAQAQWSLCIHYENGLGVELNLPEGVKWHPKAAVQGNAGAQYHLAGHYELGGSVPQDLVEAYAWYSVAAKGGWDKAVQSRDETKRKLSESQIALAHRRAAELLKKYGSCR